MKRHRLTSRQRSIARAERPEGQVGSPAALFASACHLLAQGDSAANELLPRLQRFPEYSAGWLRLGQTLSRLGQTAAANVAFEQALQARPAPVQALLGKADILIAAGKAAQAAALLADNRGRWPHDAQLAYKLGRAHYAADAWPACKKALERAVQLVPKLAEAWFYLGLVEQDMDNPTAAAQAYRQALAARPGMYEAALNLGISLQDGGELEAAMDAYGRAVRLQPACFNRVAQALTSAASGRLWLDLSVLRRVLEHRT